VRLNILLLCWSDCGRAPPRPQRESPMDGYAATQATQSGRPLPVGGEVTMLAIWYALVRPWSCSPRRGVSLPLSGGCRGRLGNAASVGGGWTWGTPHPATYLALDLWPHGGGRAKRHTIRIGKTLLDAAVVARGPIRRRYLAEGASRRAIRGARVRDRCSAASWLLALAWATYYYDRHSRQAALPLILEMGSGSRGSPERFR